MRLLVIPHEGGTPSSRFTGLGRGRSGDTT